MTKTTHKQISKKKTHDEYREIILFIIKTNYGININKIKKIITPLGDFHMSKTTVERIIRELKNEEVIKSKKSKNKICYYLPSDWNDENELEQDFKNILSDMQQNLKKFQSQYDSLNHNGKKLIVGRLKYIEEILNPIPKSYFAYIVPTESDEDQMLKMIKALVKGSSDKSKQNMLQKSKMKHSEIKKISKEILQITIQFKKIDKNSTKYFNLLPKQNKLRVKQDHFLNQLDKILLDLENNQKDN